MYSSLWGGEIIYRHHTGVFRFFLSVQTPLDTSGAKVGGGISLIFHF
jgi:hypothetical protein